MTRDEEAVNEQERRDAAYRAGDEVSRQVRAFACKFADKDVVVNWNVGDPEPMDEDNVHFVDTMSVMYQQKFERTESYICTDTNTVTENHTIPGNLRGFNVGQDWKGDVRVTPNYGPERTYTTHHRETNYKTEYVTIRAKVRCVKKGNGKQIADLEKKLLLGKERYESARQYKKYGRRMFYRAKAKWWTVAYWATHTLFFLFSFLFIAVLPELANNHEIYDVQLEFIIFKAITGSDPYPICHMVGLDPTIVCWAVCGAIVFLFLIQILFRYEMDGAIMFATVPDGFMLAIGIINLLAIPSVYFIPFARGLDAGIIHVICIVLSWIFIVLINGKILAAICAPVFFIWSAVRLIFNPEVYFLTKKEKSDEKIYQNYIKLGGIEKYERAQRRLLALYNET